MAVNERGAGRKKALTAAEIRQYKVRYQNGESVLSLSREAGVSRQTMSSYLHANAFEEKIISQYSLWVKLNREYRNADLHNYNLRIEYRDNSKCYSVILVDLTNEQIKVVNKTDHPLLRAFGVIARPSWADFMLFLEERCIPKGRFQIKQILKDLNLSQFDFLQILEKTEGRTGEDDLWLKVTYYDCKKEHAL